jgi:hypothetical protein
MLPRHTIRSLAALLVCAAPLAAQGVTVKEDKPGLLKRAKVTADAAMKAAQAKVPGATIASAEIETEKGKLIYSFDMKTAGKDGIDEVNVDAMTGAVVSVEHESPKSEAKEAAADKARGAKPKQPAKP